MRKYSKIKKIRNMYCINTFPIFLLNNMIFFETFVLLENIMNTFLNEFHNKVLKNMHFLNKKQYPSEASMHHNSQDRTY